MFILYIYYRRLGGPPHKAHSADRPQCNSVFMYIYDMICDMKRRSMERSGHTSNAWTLDMVLINLELGCLFFLHLTAVRV